MTVDWEDNHYRPRTRQPLLEPKDNRSNNQKTNTRTIWSIDRSNWTRASISARCRIESSRTKSLNIGRIKSRPPREAHTPDTNCSSIQPALRQIQGRPTHTSEAETGHERYQQLYRSHHISSLPSPHWRPRYSTSAPINPTKFQRPFVSFD